ncbi:MAG: type IA DNA topoisomerase [Lachnospiraceae bacterium]|nr:type IA DNA topoisomerase [Lachnospiraceae bacterium]
MLGILCEKPSAARNFAKALGAKQSSAPFTGTFNGEQFVIVNAIGHIYNYPKDVSVMVSPDLKDKYHKWDLSALPWDETAIQWKKVADPSKRDVIKTIKNNLLQCDEIAIATDVDPSGEGELLAWEILDALGLSPRKWSRFYFTDEAPASIQKAFKERKTIPSMLGDPDYLKADFRCKWDYLSMQFTRAATKYAGGRLLRQGRLKSAMAVITGDGLKALQNYKKIPFYQWRFKDENGIIYTDKNEPQFPDKNLVPKYEPSNVIVDSTEQKETIPPKLIDLSTLSAQLASSKGIKPKKVMDTYQTMYENQVVSYPRTEDKVITPEQFNELLPYVDRIAAVVGVDTSILTHRQPRGTHVKVGGAHGANRPGTNVPGSLAELDAKFSDGKPIASAIYEILARSYLAMLCENYRYDHQSGHIEKYPTFVGSANKGTFLGWKAVYSDPNDDEDEDNGNGLLGKIGNPFVYEGFPPKPPVPTVKWLMKQLEKRDIGTGATRTTTFADVADGSDKALIDEKRGKITLTEAGDMSYMLLPGTHIGSLEITERVFSQMKAVAEGTADADSYLREVRQLVMDDIDTMSKNASTLQDKYPEAASGQGQSKPKIKGIFAPTGKEVSFSTVWGGHTFTPDEVDRLLKGEDVSFMMKDKTGKPYEVGGRLSDFEYNGAMYFGFVRDKALTKDPSKCYGVHEPTGHKVSFARTWAGHTFTDAEVAELLKGHEITFEAVDKYGKPYRATGDLEAQSFEKNGQTINYWGFKRIVRPGDDPDKCFGVYAPLNKEISFKRIQFGHTLTDEEMKKLLNGEAISFEAVYKNGSKGMVTGKLAEMTYNGYKYWGISKEQSQVDDGKAHGLFAPKNIEVSFKKEFGGHKFTDDEIAALLRGDIISFSATSASKGTQYIATGQLTEQFYNGHKYWAFTPDFGKKGKK